MDTEVEAVEAERPQFETTSITIDGLLVEIRVPDENQLAMYRRLQRRFALADRKQKQGEELTGEQVADMLNNLFEVITSILINPDDSMYLESQILSGNMKFDQLMPIFTAGIDKLKEVNEASANRADRRAAGKAGKTAKLVTDAQL